MTKAEEEKARKVAEEQLPVASHIRVFESILKFRIASYPLLDEDIVSDEWIVAIEEQWLYRFGYDYEEYQYWKDCSDEEED
jgi:hypothetical protein